jgi:uncharacterized protein Yka (UPF0111/DUF47 family)
MSILKNKKQEFNYYDEFAKNAKFSLDCAEMLCKIVQEFDKNSLSENLKEMHKIENAADQGKHIVTNYLVKDFLPPIEREDIMSLLHKIDEVTDMVEEILINLDIFNVSNIRPVTTEFTNLLVECCKLEYEVIQEFKNFKKSKTLHEKIVALNRLEEDGDKLYINTLRSLYRESKDALEIRMWNKIYDCLEACFDTCEHVANDIETISLKNS